MPQAGTPVARIGPRQLLRGSLVHQEHNMLKTEKGIEYTAL